MLISHFVANATEHHYKLIISNFGDYIDFFDTEEFKRLKKFNIVLLTYGVSGQIQLLYYRILTSFIYRYSNSHVIRSAFKSNSGEISDFPIGSTEFLDLAKEKMVVCEGFAFRDFKAVKKHYPLIRKLFTPKPVYLKRSAKLVADIRKNFDVVIGVHIRKSDYKLFEKGKYYFENKVYLNNMNKLKEELIEKRQTCAFILCSDESVQIDDFSGLSVFGTSKIMIEDLMILAKCDFIIGPPSSFSQWASFYGETPLGVIKNDLDLVISSDYKVVDI